MASSIHGTCVAIGGAGALLLGPSGSGKSDLALRLIDQGAELVADDRVALHVAEGRLLASAPAGLPPLLEVRGIGLLPVRPRPGGVPVTAVFRLERASERLPLPDAWQYEGASVPSFPLDPAAPSAAARVRAVMTSMPVAV
jgi:HPr kinase/phosphorylase